MAGERKHRNSKPRSAGQWLLGVDVFACLVDAAANVLQLLRSR